MILIEDLHWADAETRLVFASLVAILATARVLLIATQRPEGAKLEVPHVHLDLSPLDTEASRQLVDLLMGDDIGLTQIKRSILAQAGGNPLFLEELVQALRDRKILEGPPGNLRLKEGSQRIDIPETIHSVLAARIDVLGGLPKSLLQIASVIGKDVPVALLVSMVGLAPNELAPQLEMLEAADFLYKVKAELAPEDAFKHEYSFKHEFTREVAYGTILTGLRRTLHAKLVDIIELRFADRLDEYIDRLADHAFHAELWEKAIPYQLRSCRRAGKRGANQNAISIFERGLETLSHLPPSDARNKAQIDFRLTVIVALEPLGRHRRIAQVLREARSFAETLADPLRMTAVNCQLGVALWRLGEHDGAMAAAERASALANTIGDASLIFAALAITGMVYHEVAPLPKAVEIHERCLALETPDLDERRAGWAAYPSVILRAFLADFLTDLGEFARAGVRCRGWGQQGRGGRPCLFACQHQPRACPGLVGPGPACASPSAAGGFLAELSRSRNGPDVPDLRGAAGRSPSGARGCSIRSRHPVGTGEARRAVGGTCLRLALSVPGARPRSSRRGQARRGARRR